MCETLVSDPSHPTRSARTSDLKYQTPEAFAAARPFDKTQWGRSRMSDLMAPRPRPLLTPPNDGTQKKNIPDLRVGPEYGGRSPDVRLQYQFFEVPKGQAAISHRPAGVRGIFRTP